MEMPKYHETFIPILETLRDGKSIHSGDVSNKVLNKYYSHLPEELLSKKTKSGGSLLLDRIGWGISYLKQGKYLDYPKRGMVQITSKGLEVLSHGTLTLKQLKSDPDFLEYHKQKNEQKKANENSFDSSTSEDLIESGISDIEAQVKADLLDKLKTVNP